MLTLVVKLILFLLGLVLSVNETPSTLQVTAFLVAITLTSLNGYFHRKRVTRVSFVAYVGACVLFPEFCSFLPLLCFDTFEYEPRFLVVFALIPFVKNTVRITETAFILVLIALALLLRYLHDKTTSLANENLEIRDDSREENRNLMLQNKQLLDKQEYEVHLATLRERNRIAREIHDNVGHALSRSILQAGAVQVTCKDETLAVQLSALKDTLSHAMDSIRGSVHDLKDESVDLRDTLVQMLDMDGYEIWFDYDVSGSVPNDVKYSFIATVKETLTNITKHSDATIINVAVREHPALYQLLVHDNGAKKPSRHNDGMGLSNMEERVKALGGYFTAGYQDGFRVFISIPKKEEQA